jgi:hypothetical protein
MRRRHLPALLLAALLPALSACALHHDIPLAQIQAQLAARFPVEKAAGPWVVRFAEPVVTLDAERDRVGLGLSIGAAGLAPGAHGLGFQSVAGKAAVTGHLAYDRTAGAFFLRDPSVEQLSFTGLSPELELPLRLAAEGAIRLVLHDRPLFVLDPKRSDREALARDHLLKVWVERDKLVVEYKL